MRVFTDTDAGLPDGNNATSNSEDSPNSNRDGNNGLPSPPGNALQISAQTPPQPLAPLGPLTPPTVNDTSDKGLTNAFYNYFHAAHPFLPPMRPTTWTPQQYPFNPVPRHTQPTLIQPRLLSYHVRLVLYYPPFRPYLLSSLIL